MRKESYILFLSSLVFCFFYQKAAFAESPCQSKHFFSIDEILELAETHSPALMLSKSQSMRLDGKLIAARSNFFPNVFLEAELSKGNRELSDIEEEISISSNEKFKLGLLIDQKIYTGGRNTATYQKAKDLKRAEEYRLESIKNHLFFKLKEQHVKYLLSKEKIKNINELKNKIQKEFSKEKDRHLAGKTPQVYVLRLELALNRQEAKLISEKQNLNSIKNTIIQLSGLEQAYHKQDIAKLDFKGKLGSSYQEEPLNELLQKALQQRPEIKRFKNLISAAREEIKTQKSKLLPDVSFFASYGNESSDNITLSSNKDLNFKMGISGKWAIFDSFETKGLVKAADAEKLQREHQAREFLLSLEQDVRDSFNKLTEAKSLLKNAKNIRLRAKKALNQIKDRFEAGAEAQLDVLEAQITLHDALELETDSLYKISLAKVYLNKALGDTRLSNES